MNKQQKLALLASRLSLGWLFLYAGITKITDSNWSAAGYLQNAKSFTSLFQWFANESNLGWVNFVNEWGLALVGLSLILGFWVRWSSLAGIGLMVLYYLPVLSFPYAGDHYFLVDDHIIFLLVFVVLYVYEAGNYWGIDGARRKRT